MPARAATPAAAPAIPAQRPLQAGQQLRDGVSGFALVQRMFQQRSGLLDTERADIAGNAFQCMRQSFGAGNIAGLQRNADMRQHIALAGKEFAQ